LLGGRFDVVDETPSDNTVRLLGSPTIRFRLPALSPTGFFQAVIGNHLATSVRIETSEDLRNWVSLSPLANLTGFVSITDDTPAESSKQRFFRAAAE
jgi:hypothetical protein